jgi:tetratricopeptide (TPR) repeat protein
MHRRTLPIWLAFALAALLAVPLGAPRPATGDDVPLTPEEEERLEAIDRHTEKGLKAFRTGNHDEVLERMKRLAKYDPTNPLPLYLTARVHDRTGAYDKALDVATAAATAHPEDRAIEAIRFRVLLAVGKHDAAATAARAALKERPNDLVARTVLGMTMEERGRRDEALAEYDKVVETYNTSDPVPAEIPWVGHAAIRATWLSPNPADDMITVAAKMLSRYVKDNPEDLDAKLQLAEVFRADRGSEGQSVAGKYFRQILTENTEVAEARVGQARIALMFYKQGAALKALDRALQTNPNLVSALTVKAMIHVGNGDYERARKALKKALEVNPVDKEARAVQAALHWIRGRKEAFAALEKELLAYDPTYGELYVICADLVGERQRRYFRAAEFARKAIATDPSNFSAYVTLGEALMNTGRTDEALEVFRKGVEKSKRWADVRRDNWIEVLSKWMPKFKVLETENFRIRMPLGEARVMRHYLPDLLEESWSALTKKYDFVPLSPTYADSFDRGDDFSVRSVGSTGLPALGVCFGNVITLLGPTSKPIGQFSWSRTAWHEFAHVITLQLSKGQVPRWLTEGLSVYEEKARRDRWGRDMERQLFDRWHNGRLLKMARINQAFRGPDILFAYYQGGLIAEHLQQERGFDVIPRMLKAFAEDKTTAEVFKDVLGLELAKYDEMFHAHVGTIVGDYKMVPSWDSKSLDAFRARTKKDASDVEAWIRLAWAQFQRRRQIDAGEALHVAMELDPKHPEVLLLQGRMAQVNRRADVAAERYERFLEGGGDDLQVRLFLAERELQGASDSEAAIAHLQAAKRCFPRYIAKNSPYLQLAKLYRGGGDMVASMKELEAFAAIAAEHYGVRKELKQWYKSKGDHAAVARVCEEMVDISPFGANIREGEPPDMDLHRDYAEALEALGRGDEVLRERRVQVEIGGLLPEEKRVGAGVVEDRLALGRLLLERGEAVEALAEALAALRLAPKNVSALMLKRQAMEAGGTR